MRDPDESGVFEVAWVTQEMRRPNFQDHFLRELKLQAQSGSEWAKRVLQKYKDDEAPL